MSHDEIMAMAREAGMNLTPAQFSGVLEDEVDEFKLERFAALVAAAEREACAALIESTTERSRWIRGGINGAPIEPCQYAAAIRARCMP